MMAPTLYHQILSSSTSPSKPPTTLHIFDPTHKNITSPPWGTKWHHPLLSTPTPSTTSTTPFPTRSPPTKMCKKAQPFFTPQWLRENPSYSEQWEWKQPQTLVPSGIAEIVWISENDYILLPNTEWHPSTAIVGGKFKNVQPHSKYWVESHYWCNWWVILKAAGDLKSAGRFINVYPYYQVPIDTHNHWCNWRQIWKLWCTRVVLYTIAIIGSKFENVMLSTTAKVGDKFEKYTHINSSKRLLVTAGIVCGETKTPMSAVDSKIV